MRSAALLESLTVSLAAPLALVSLFGIASSAVLGACSSYTPDGSSEEQTSSQSAPLIVAQQAKLVGNDLVANDDYGMSIAVSGDTAVIGASGKNSNTGAAYVFQRTGATWSQQSKIIAGDSVAGDYFGEAVAISGDTAIIGTWRSSGTSGAAYVFVRNGTTWAQQAKLTTGVAGGGFGFSVALSGDTAVIGAMGENYARGAAYVYVRSGSTWSKKAKLTANDAEVNDALGWSVAVDKDTAVVGAPSKNEYTGSAYVFVRTSTSWTRQATLVASDGFADQNFAKAVGVSGDSVILGAPGTSAGGSAYVFTRSGTSWSLQKKLRPLNTEPYDYFGASVDLRGDKALVGAPWKNDYAGQAVLFTRSGVTWSELSVLTPSDGKAEDKFGTRAALTDDTALVSTEAWSSYLGAAYVFTMTKGQGDSCASGTECQSSFCVDGVCCDTACGSGSADDCMTCSKAKGGVADGTCGPVSDGASCSDGNACTQGDTCTAGACTAGGPVSCQALDDCHEPGTCDPVSGCSNPAKTDGTICDDDNACTKIDACKAGKCTGSGAVTCSASDECHSPGTCNPSTGACSAEKAKANGASCDDGNACTQKDTCQSGKCTGADLVTCEASDQCHQAGSCDAETGKCTEVAKADGTSCDDGNACTQKDSCQAGKCASGPAVVCAADDECHEDGQCDPRSGCAAVAKPDGTPCSGGECVEGVCVEANPEPGQEEVTDPPASSDESGCGCRTSPSTSGSYLGIAAILLSLTIARRKKH